MPTVDPKIIRYLRTLHKKTQQELGNEIGVGKAAISRIENCKGLANVRHSTLTNLCRKFSCTHDYLAGKVKNPNEYADSELINPFQIIDINNNTLFTEVRTFSKSQVNLARLMIKAISRSNVFELKIIEAFLKSLPANAETDFLYLDKFFYYINQLILYKIEKIVVDMETSGYIVNLTNEIKSTIAQEEIRDRSKRLQRAEHLFKKEFRKSEYFNKINNVLEENFEYALLEALSAYYTKI